MGGCCRGGEARFEGLSADYRRRLWAVVAINAVMFAVEMTAGHLARSQALQADALDFFGDTVTYGLSLFVIGRGIAMRSGAAVIKGVSLGAMGLFVFGSTIYRVFVTGMPQAEVMGLIGVLALTANLASVGLLVRYRDGDANIRSVWLCSRNDAVGNLAVMGAAAAVWLTATPWPDLLVAAVMASLFLASAVQILRQARGEWREHRDAQPASGETLAQL